MNILILNHITYGICRKAADASEMPHVYIYKYIYLHILNHVTYEYPYVEKYKNLWYLQEGCRCLRDAKYAMSQLST